MIRMPHVSAGLAILILGGCASVARDAGVPEISQSVNERANQELEFQDQPRMTDDPRVLGMLEGELDADKAVAVAMINNPRLQVILAEVGIARADLIEASTISNPIVEIETRGPGEPFRPFEITLAQSLIELIQLPRRRALGRDMFEAAKLRVSREVLAFSADVRSDYYALLAASQNLTQSETISDAAIASTELAIRQHTAGNITDLDLEHEQAVYEESKLALAEAEERVMLRREALIRAMGLRDDGMAWSIPSEFPQPPAEEMSDEEITSLALTRRLDIDIARREVAIAERSVPIARLAALGEIVVDVHHEREPDGSRTTGPGIEFPIPIFNSGRAARNRAEAEYLRARHQLALVTAQASSEIRAARQSLMSARARVDYYRDVLLPRRARIVELTKLQQNSMLVGVYQVLEARQNEARAHREYIDAQLAYWSARNNLDRALNGTEMMQREDAMGSGERSSSVGQRGDH